MTKALTEQWKNGELEGGHYYLLMKDGSTRIANTVYVVGEKQFYWENTSIDFVQEVLDPVPSYEKVKKLKEQIKEANECIEDKYLWTCSACSLLGSCMSCGNRYFGRYIKKWGVE